MLCQKCKQHPATVHYRENINGRVTEYALCAECAGSIHPPTASLFDDDTSLGSLFSAMLGSRPIREEKKCPLCSSGFAEIARTGKVGCPTCYETFAEDLAPTVTRLHGNARPVGRAPKRLGDRRRREQELASLRADLKKAIEAEEFEKACEIRDKIRELEGE